MSVDAVQLTVIWRVLGPETAATFVGVVGGDVSACMTSDVVPVLVAKPVAPLYVTVIVSVPVLRAVVEMLAVPPVRATLEASVVEPDLNVTVPVGVPAAEVTVAVIVTLKPVV